MKDLDKITQIQIAEAIENIKSCKDLETSLRKGQNKLERELNIHRAGALEFKDVIESLSVYDPGYKQLMRNGTTGHRGFSSLHGCG